MQGIQLIRQCFLVLLLLTASLLCLAEDEAASNVKNVDNADFVPAAVVPQTLDWRKHYPKSARVSGRTATARIGLMVSKDGIPFEPWIVDSTDPSFNEAALRTVNNASYQEEKWQEMPIDSYLEIDIRFSELAFDPNTDYELPKSWGDCQLQVLGSPGASARLIQQ